MKGRTQPLFMLLDTTRNAASDFSLKAGFRSWTSYPFYVFYFPSPLAIACRVFLLSNSILLTRRNNCRSAAHLFSPRSENKDLALKEQNNSL